jgi:23S rRNA U2552 (ribose-2'-O)-methylase RlmE/FtsJ
MTFLPKREHFDMNSIISMLTKTEKIILACIFGSVPAGLLFIFIFFTFFGPSTRQLITERDSLESVRGTVDTLFNDLKNHDIRTAVLTNHQTYYILREWESEIETGDSLYKKKGSFLLEVYKKNDKKVILDYRPTIRR